MELQESDAAMSTNFIEQKVLEMIIENVFSWIHGPKNTPATESGALTVTESGEIDFFITIKKITDLQADFVGDAVCDPCDPTPMNDVLSANLEHFEEAGGYYILKIVWNVTSQRTIQWKVTGRNP